MLSTYKLLCLNFYQCKWRHKKFFKCWRLSKDSYYYLIQNTDFSAIGRESQYTRDAFLITAAFSRLSAEITTQLPSEVAGNAMKAPTNYFPRGSPPKVTRHTSPIRGRTDEVFNEEKTNTEIIAHVRLIVVMVDMQSHCRHISRINGINFCRNFYFEIIFILFLSLAPVYQANELLFNI